ncbi:MAG TPA: hypothetical protein VGK41_07670, partial [Solirubrobacterales bacterium]
MLKEEAVAYVVVMGAFGGLTFASARTSLRMFQAGMRLSSEGVVVRGPVRTWRVERADAVRFVAGRQESGFAGELLFCT